VLPQNDQVQLPLIACPEDRILAQDNLTSLIVLPFQLLASVPQQGSTVKQKTTIYRALPRISHAHTANRYSPFSFLECIAVYGVQNRQILPA
jgi:hypothetical protein